MKPTEVLAAIERWALDCPPEEIPAVLGQLEVWRVLVRARLLAPAPAPAPDPLRCLTMIEAAKESGILESTLREAGRRYERGDADGLETVHIGRWIYVRQETLERWIAARESKRP
jgi:hypothetical protein